MARLAAGDRLVLATHNAGKLAEVTALLAGTGVAVLSAVALGLPVPEETEATFVGNARIKAHAAVRATGLPALADDSGLCVDALGGAPGVRSADWADVGGGREFGVAMERLRDALGASPEPWRAQFRAVLVLAWPDGRDDVFDGVCEGRIVWPGRGVGGHGYDPVFQPDGLTVSMAELSQAEKNRISHRAIALRALLAACFT